MENCDNRIRKIHVKGKRFPIEVGMKQVLLTDTVVEGKRIPNGTINLYDTGGVFTDLDYRHDVRKESRACARPGTPTMTITYSLPNSPQNTPTSS